MSKRCLVTGGAGFIGSNLVDRLVNDGHDVTVIDNESSDAHNQFYWNPKTKNYKYDISDYTLTQKLYEGMDVVFHLAAESRIQPCIIDPLKAVKANILGTACVLECSRVCGVKRVVYSSTSAVYGLKNEPPMVETMPNDCLNPYSVTKTGGEELCKMYAKMYGLQTVIFRYFNVYGDRQPVRGQYAPVIGIFLRQRAAGEPMTIVGDGEQRRDFIHVSDVVRANVLAAEMNPLSPWEWGQIYNIGSGTNHSVNEIVKIIGGQTQNVSARLGEVRTSCANINKIKSHFDWSPKINIEDWIERNK